jgi:hypothetical protein
LAPRNARGWHDLNGLLLLDATSLCCVSELQQWLLRRISTPQQRLLRHISKLWLLRRSGTRFHITTADAATEVGTADLSLQQHRATTECKNSM